MADAVRIALRDPSSAHHERAKAAFAKPPEDRPRTDRVSLTRLVLKLVVLAGGQSGTVADISINKSFISVTKGDVALDADGFRLDDFGVNGHQLLKPRPDAA